MGPAGVDAVIRRALLLLALASACGSSSHGPRTTPRQVEVLLNEPLASAQQVGALAPDFDVSPDRLVVLADAANLYELGWGGLAAIDGLGGAESLAFTPDGLLLVVRGTQLLYLGESGALEVFFELPHAGMALASQPDGVYLFDRASTGNAHAIYELTPGGRIAKLLESPQPIDAIARAGDRLLFVSGGVVFEAEVGKPLRLVARLAESTIRSVAADADHVYVSDGTSVFSLSDDGVVLVTATAGGSLRVRDGALLVLDPAKRTLIRLAPR
jgi:hypothetical protein